MTLEKPPETANDQDFVKSIFDRRGKQDPAAKKISSLFGGAPPKPAKAPDEAKKTLKELSPVGIEIEAGSIAAVQLGRSDGQWQVARSVSRAMAIERGSLRQFLSESGMKGSAVIGLSADDVQFRVLNLPPMPEAEIDGAVAWGLAEALGIEARRIGDYSIDYALLTEADTSARGKKVFVAAVRKDTVTEKMKEVSDAGLDVIAAEPSALALYSAFSSVSAQDASRLALLLNIGRSSSFLVIAAGRDVYSVQPLSFSADMLRGALNDEGAVVSQQSASAFENLIVDMEHSYKSVSNQFQNPGTVALGVIAVTGPGAKEKGIGAFLKKTFNIPVEILDPLNAGVEFAAAAGLAMRGRKEDEAL